MISTKYFNINLILMHLLLILNYIISIICAYLAYKRVSNKFYTSYRLLYLRSLNRIKYPLRNQLCQKRKRTHHRADALRDMETTVTAKQVYKPKTSHSQSRLTFLNLFSCSPTHKAYHLILSDNLSNNSCSLES